MPRRVLAPHRGAVLGSPGGFPFFSHPLRGGIGCSFDFIFVIFCRSLSTTVVAYGADDRLAAVTDVYVTDHHLLAGFPRWRFRASICAVKVRNNFVARLMLVSIPSVVWSFSDARLRHSTAKV